MLHFEAGRITYSDPQPLTRRNWGKPIRVFSYLGILLEFFGGVSVKELRSNRLRLTLASSGENSYIVIVNPDPTQVTELLQKLGSGDKSAVDSLMPLIYEHLKRIALGQLKSERPDHTLNATALVHEAFLKMVDQRSADWKGRAHFLAVASQAMRRILIDYARSRMAGKRGGGAPIVTFNDEVVGGQARAEELIALDLALETLEKVDPRQRQIVEYHFFGGLTHGEIAELLNVAEVTVRRDWRHARAWLSQRLGAL